MLLSGFVALFPASAQAQEGPAKSIETAKAAIELARKAGAERSAADELAAGTSWLAQAEKAQAAASTVLARVRTERAKKAGDEEIVYFATMARI